MSGRAQPLPPLQGGMLVIATIGISVVTAMTVLDSTIANVALPTIAGNLGVASSQGTWVITFFGVANAIAIPLTGWLARRMGEVRLYFWSTFLFVVASFLCGISSSLGMLIICRILQGPPRASFRQRAGQPGGPPAASWGRCGTPAPG